MMPVLKEMAIDAMTFHWDSAYSIENLKELAEEAGIPVLAANMYSKDNDERYFEPYLIQQVGQIKVGVIGLAAHILDKTTPERFREGQYLTIGDEELGGLIEEVRGQGADLILLLSHNGLNQDIQLLKDVPGIDICLSSHTHNRIHEPITVGETIVIQSGSHGSFLGRIDLDFDGQIKHLRHELIEVGPSISEDESMAKLVDEALEKNRDKLAEVVGCTEELLHRATTLSATMDDLLLEAMLQAAGAEIAFSVGWRYGAPIPPGEITLGELYQIVPMDPPLRRVKLRGDEIKQMIEENLEATYSCDPHDQRGGYVKRMRGLKVYVKIENPCQLRVQEIIIGQDKMVADKRYDVVYLTRQGVPEKYGQDHEVLEISAIEALRELLKEDCYRETTSPAITVI
ncbi:MAG TPA: bifunctional metallophosphatase/5'-nucleotidase [Tissierellia bacterium]|nr:bifunctional metallophosphatase/5'-nucleotidase [Tissierellia bacterium]